jgi:hypothetical protein
VRRGRTTTGRGVGLGATLTTVRLGATLTGVRTGGHPTSSRSWSPSHRCGVGSELAIAVLEATTPGAATLRQSTPARIHRLMVVPPLCLTLSSQRQPKFYQFVYSSNLDLVLRAEQMAPAVGIRRVGALEWSPARGLGVLEVREHPDGDGGASSASRPTTIRVGSGRLVRPLRQLIWDWRLRTRWYSEECERVDAVR